MATIVTYTDQKPPENLYPTRIISPPHSGPCCFTEREQVGGPHQDSRSVFLYQRCKKCGFAVRVIQHEIPDEALIASLRKTLAEAFAREATES
ncbi:MAG TPA: hypothetical protein VN648_25295 [Candidatus Methylomirabilis sp.]|nr:hypothetical protein [Candidatus Methylomirabilis sp.]